MRSPPLAKVHLERDWMRGAMKVYMLVGEQGGNYGAVVGFNPDNGEPLLQTFEQGMDCPPAFVVPDSWLEDIVREAAGAMPASDATVDALKDARAVRDRLLTIVEKAHEGWKP